MVNILSMTSVVEIRVPSQYADLSKKIIIDSLEAKLRNLEGLREELVRRLKRLCEKYNCECEDLEERLKVIDDAEVDLDWVEYVAVREMIKDVDKKIEILRIIIEQNKA